MISGRNYIKRGISYLRRNGIVRTVSKGIERLYADNAERGYVPFHADEEELRFQRSKRFQNPYKFSILVPVYETDHELFRKMLDSVGDQTYGNWELVLADASLDDSRRQVVDSFTEEKGVLCDDDYGTLTHKVHYIHIGENKGISGNTNEALKYATGDYIGLLDHDDVLENTALFDIMTGIEAVGEKEGTDGRAPAVRVVYTDEDKLSGDGSRCYDVNRKPDFDPVLLRTNNYICHFLVVETGLAKSVGGFRSGYDGAQDHDFVLRCTERVGRDDIIHIPKVLYHWRSTAASTAENPEAKLYAYRAGARAIADAYQRAGIEVRVTDTPHLGFFDIEYKKPDRNVLCISTEEFRAVPDKVWEDSDCGFIMLLSRSLMPQSEEYIRDMESCMCLPYVGAVTGRIIGRDGKIESAGFDIGDDGEKIPRFSGLRASFSGYMHRAVLHQLVEGFSPDCVLLRRDALDRTSSDISLKPGFDVYYMPKAVFKRKKK